VTKTVLFFGDSNTRGYGVGPAHRYAAHVEAALAPTTEDWRFIVRSAHSDFHAIAARLHDAIAQHCPDVLVWQLPTGPAAYSVRYPWWLRPARSAYSTVFRWRREWGIRRQIARAPSADDARRHVLSEGRFVDALYGWRPARWPGTRHVNGWLAARYGLFVKATGERYLELVERHRDRVRAASNARLLFIGPVPHNDDMYPGFGERVTAWSEDLARLLHHPAKGSIYVDAYRPLAAHPDRHLIGDGCHLTPAGHLRLSTLVVPALVPLMQSCEVSEQPQCEVR
jgi:lysophospholipase L1-like esterase